MRAIYSTTETNYPPLLALILQRIKNDAGLRKPGSTVADGSFYYCIYKFSHIAYYQKEGKQL